MKTKFSIFLILVSLFLIYWMWWIPGARVANDFSLVSNSSLKTQMDLPQTWSTKGTEGLGEYTVFTLWSYPFSFLNGVFANLGFSFTVLERVLIIIPILLIGTLGMWKFGEYLKLSNYAKFISTLFYLTNTYIFLLIDGGQLTIGLAYAFFPLAFLAVEDSLTKGFKKRIWAAFLVSVMGVFDIRFIFILFLLCLIRFLYSFSGTSWIKSWFKTAITIIPIYIGLNFYWLLVIFKAPLSRGTFASLTQISFVSFISLGHALLLLSPHWFKNVFGDVIQLRFEFILIPLLVFLAPVLRPKNKQVGFWLLVALISVFLAKGSSVPLSNIYPWLYSHVLGFSLFRDSSKFFFLVALAYSALLGITTDEISKRINKFPKFKLLFVFLLSAYFIFLIRPIWQGFMTGTFSSPYLQQEYSQLTSIISADTKSGNVFWIPTINPLTSLDQSHPSVEASRLVQKRPFAQAVVGTYETFNYLREAPYMGQLFDVANIGYIAYPSLDYRRANPHPDNTKYYYTFLNQLSNLPWLSKVENSPVPLFKVKNSQDKLFIPSNTWWVVGSDDIYKESTTSSKLVLSNNALIFAEDMGGLGKRIDELPSSKIVLYDKTALDLAADFIENDNLIFPAKYLKRDPDSSGWWERDTSELIQWKDFLKTKYGIINQDFDFGGGWAVGEGSLKLKIQSSKIRKENILLARVLESSKSGELRFYQEDKLIGKVNTRENKSNVRWFEVGKLIDDQTITIQSIGDINVVNTVVSIPVNTWVDYKNKSSKLQDRIVNFDEKNTDQEVASLSYKQVSPTKYIVNIQNLNKPSMLIFSQNFDKNWKLGGHSPLPVYSLLNGYDIEKNGSYELNFEPQNYIPFGLTISIATLVICIVFLLL